MNPAWRVMGSSVQGAAHARAGRGCEDAFTANLTRRRPRVPDRAPLVLVVCDGAGTCPRSAEGAALAVELAVSVFEEYYLVRPPETVAAWNRYLGDGLCLVTERFGRATGALPGVGEPGDFATTLLVAVASPPWLGLVSVGDGFVVVRTAFQGRDDYHLIVAPVSDGRPAGVTTFLTSGPADPARSTWTLWDPHVTGVALSTDGLTDLVLELEGSRLLRPHRDFFRPWFQRADDPDSLGDDLARFLASERVCRRTSDDKTLVLAVRRGP